MAARDRVSTNVVSLRLAAADDAAHLARMNRHLIDDEMSRNSMDFDALTNRMLGWIQGEYKAVLFQCEEEIVGYALFRPDADGIYLRQFFIERSHRRQGLGRNCFAALKSAHLAGNRVTLDVLETNPDGLEFWKAIGFRPYARTLKCDC